MVSTGSTDGSNPTASVDIDAPIDTVWQVMLDTAAYGEWNPFVFQADCPSPPSPGDPIVLHVRWSNGKTVTSPERVTVVDAPAPDPEGVRRATLSYVYEGWPSKVGLLRATRFQRLTQRDGGPTTYNTVEEFSGPLVRFAGPGRVAEGFRRHAAALKERAESLA
jgi:hypothetical protein